MLPFERQLKQEEKKKKGKNPQAESDMLLPF